MPPQTEEELAWLDNIADNVDLPEADFVEQMKQSLREGRKGTPLKNDAYRFNPPGVVRNPFENLDKPGYEAETRELLALAESFEQEDEA